ncbi:carbohydrate deacetylase [Thermodesulfobacteriota bacterium]
MKLIFHGDDFGLTPGINRAILQAYKHGLLTSASIIVNGEAADVAMELAKNNPEMDIGVHLTLCDETPVLASRDLSSLISNGSLLPSRQKVLQAVLFRKIDYKQVESEWSAQIETCLDANIPISHIDSHQFLHLFPGLFPVCLRLATKYQIAYIRVANRDVISFDAGVKRFFQWMCLRFWSNRFILPRLPSQIKCVPSIGFLKAGGRMSRNGFLNSIDKIRRKRSIRVIEVILHPGIGDVYTRNKYQHWQYDWHNDLKLLLDPFLKEELVRRSVGLTSFKEQA